MTKKLNIAVLMGGKSPEFDVSMLSGREVIRNLDTSLYNILPVVISQDGRKWRISNKNEILALGSPFDKARKSKDLMKVRGQKDINSVNNLKDEGVDVVFIAMHGPYGEDGTIQGMLELAGLNYTGSKLLASAIGMDKIMFRRVLASEGIPYPKYVMIRKTGFARKVIDKFKNPPYFVKPYNQGSSVGCSIVRQNGGLSKALELAFEFSEIALVDEYIRGKELTCGVIGNDEPRALPVIEIVPRKGEFFNYDSKYTESGADEIVPAKISKKNEMRIRKEAIRVYKLIGCRGFGRVDFILKDDGNFVVLEINTIPGLTPTSLLPKASSAAGISYKELLNYVIDYARHK
ncbi:D-alanine--D-alanine ligase [Candidatus Woesebacteria bacterium]|nr:D-alanine--D-alanine ligase [Candidatus Woesebacteria bacterium]